MVETPLSVRNRLEHWRGSYAETAQAPSWLTAHQWTYGEDVARQTAEDVRRKLNLQPDDRLLEIGAGSGAFLESLLHDGQAGIGFDFCCDQVRSMDRFGVDKRCVKMGVAEACRLPVASGTFDKVLCYSVAHYFPDHQYLRFTITEMLRIVRPGGVALMGDVGGVMERTRQILVRAGVPGRAAEGFLWLLLPARHLYRTMTPRRPREGRFYRRSSLRRMLNEMPCTFEFLDQAIPGRTASRCRFDIRMVRVE